jgi:hypothetical protein
MPKDGLLEAKPVKVTPATKVILASQLIDEKHRGLGGNAGPLGVAIEEVRACLDGRGFSRRFRNGVIYWSRTSGAHEVRGAILDKWSSLGFEAGHLGYPVSDELGTPDGIGRFNRFEKGMIYWTPATGAHEIHGDILARWSTIGYERSFLGYPVSDEVDYAEGGRASFFQNGGIYWWSDVGAVELRDVVVHYTGLICFGETDHDQFSPSDEPYAVIGVVAPGVATSTRTPIYQDVDGGEARPDLIELYRGAPRGIALGVLLMENDLSDPDKARAAMQEAVEKALPLVGSTLAFVPVIGPVVAAVAATLAAIVGPEIAKWLADVADFGDDKLGEETLALSAKQMVVLAARTSNTWERGVGFKLSTKLMSADGASYKVYFGIVPA